MDEIISFEGLKKLKDIKMSGGELPRNWESLVKKYLDFKIKYIREWAENKKKQIIELENAILIVKYLGMRNTEKWENELNKVKEEVEEL